MILYFIYILSILTQLSSYNFPILRAYQSYHANAIEMCAINCNNILDLDSIGFTAINTKTMRSTSLKAINFRNDISSNKKCTVCTGKGGINCATCKGTGIDKVAGNIFERWTCKKCKGFGYLPCPSCAVDKSGLTPEQRGER